MISPEIIFDITETVVSSKGKVMLAEPQRAYMFEANVYDPLGSDKAEAITLFLTSMAIPASSTEIIHKRYMGQEYSITGQDTSQRSFTMTLWDDDTLYSYRYMNQWFNVVNDPMYNRSVGYKKASKDVEIQLKNRFDNRTTGSILLSGCVVSEIAAVPINYADSSNFTFDVTFSYKHKIFNGVDDQYRFGR